MLKNGRLLKMVFIFIFFYYIKSKTYETIQIDDPNFRIKHFPREKSNPHL